MVRDKDLPCLLGFGGFLLQNNHSLVRDKVADTDVEHFSNASCGPIEDLRDKSVFLGEMGLDEVPFLPGEHLGLPRPIDLERDSHRRTPGMTKLYDISAQTISSKKPLVELSRELQPPVPVRTGGLSRSTGLRREMRQVNDIYWTPCHWYTCIILGSPNWSRCPTQRNGVISPSDTSNPQETGQMRASTAVTTKVIRPSCASP